MKNALLIAMAWLSSLLSFSQGGPFSLTCKMKPEQSGKVAIWYAVNSRWIADSAVIRNGEAVLTGKVDHPTYASLTYGEQRRELFLEPATMRLDAVNVPFSDSRITGSKTNIEFQDFYDKKSKTDRRWKRAIDSVVAISRRNNFAGQELKAWALEPYFDEIADNALSFINKYKSSYPVAYVLSQVARDLPTDSLHAKYDRLSANAKKSFYGKNIFSDLEKRKIAAVGVSAPNFSRKDIDGKDLELARFAGKYVLLDFWGSWCVPCRKGNPHLIELYKKYKDRGLEIIGIAADDNNPDAWRKAVAEDRLPWLHVLSGNKPETDLSRQYNILSFPTKILIDQRGMIIGRYDESEGELDKKLAAVFK